MASTIGLPGAPSAPLPVELLRHLGAGPLVHRALHREGDRRANELGEASWSSTAASNTVRLAAIGPVLAAMEREGVEAVLIKGMASVVRFPHLISVRPMADVDLVVSPGDYRRAGVVLSGLGGSPLPRTMRRMDCWGPERVWIMSSGAGEGAVLFRLAIDLHRGFGFGPLFNRLLSDTLSARTIVDKVPVPTLSHCLCLSLAHRARHRFAIDLREFLDFRLCLDELWAEGDAAVDLLMEGVQRYRLWGALYGYLRLVGRFFPPSAKADAGEPDACLLPIAWRHINRRQRRFFGEQDQDPVAGGLFPYPVSPVLPRTGGGPEAGLHPRDLLPMWDQTVALAAATGSPLRAWRGAVVQVATWAADAVASPEEAGSRNLRPRLRRAFSSLRRSGRK